MYGCSKFFSRRTFSNKTLAGNYLEKCPVPLLIDILISNNFSSDIFLGKAYFTSYRSSKIVYNDSL